MSLKTGEISWQVATENGQKNGKDAFLRLSPGSNVVRLITMPHQYYQHKYKVSASDKFGSRITCSTPSGTGCPVCDKGDKPKRRWYVGVIDKKTGTSKILDFSYAVLKGIQAYANDEDWGSPLNYDIDIVVDPNGGATSYYTVVAKPKKPLNASELQLKDAFDAEELARRTLPPTHSQVVEKLEKMANKPAGQGGEKSSGLPVKSSSVASVEDDDDDFADFDASSSSF